MKQIISLFTVAAVMAVSCNPKSNSSETGAPKEVTATSQDTTGLAAYQQWKAQNELVTTSQYNANADATPVNLSNGSASRNTTTANKTSGTKSSSSSKSSSSKSTSGSGSSTAGTSGSGTSNTGTTSKAPEKKGISKAAKGAIIGGVAGAAGGAVINKKNRGAGAVIGGVLGAGAGYGIGRHKDKKDGRN